MLKLSEPLLFYFSSVELFQEIDSYAKQCSKEHNAERIWEWVLKTKVGRRPYANAQQSTGASQAVQTSWESDSFHGTLQPSLGENMTSHPYVMSISRISISQTHA